MPTNNSLQQHSRIRLQSQPCQSALYKEPVSGNSHTYGWIKREMWEEGIMTKPPPLGALSPNYWGRENGGSLEQMKDYRNIPEWLACSLCGFHQVRCYRKIWQPAGCSQAQERLTITWTSCFSSFQVWPPARFPLWTWSPPSGRQGAAAELSGSSRGSVAEQMGFLNPPPALESFSVESKLLHLSPPWFPHQPNRRPNSSNKREGSNDIVYAACEILGTPKVISIIASTINIPFIFMMSIKNEISYAKELWEKILNAKALIYRGQSGLHNNLDNLYFAVRGLFQKNPSHKRLFFFFHIAWLDTFQKVLVYQHGLGETRQDNYAECSPKALTLVPTS